MNQSLFGHLAYQFAKSPENLATEALSYILNRSDIAKKALVRFLSQTGWDYQNQLTFETQSGDTDQAIPDLIGLDANRRPVIIGEAKFWAGLTHNQPVTYLKRLIDTGGSVLLFIAPSRRFVTLWPELTRRCITAGFQLQPKDKISEALLSARVNGEYLLILASWRAILASIRLALETEGDAQTAADVVQLEGLCDRMDENAFLPIRSEELTSNTATRLIQYYELISEVTKILVKQQIASTDGYHPAGTAGRYVHYFKVKQYGLSLQFNWELWSTQRLTPLWLSVKKAEKAYWEYSAEAKEKLHSYKIKEPSDLIEVNGEQFIPIYLPLDVEKKDVVNAILEQVQKVIDLLLADTATYNQNS